MHALTLLLAAALLTPPPGSTPAGSSDADRDAAAPVQTDAGDLLRSPDVPLDERVSAEHVTEGDLPPLPEGVVLPKPPEFRLAEDASRLPISEASFEEAIDSIRRGVAYLRSTQGAEGGWLDGARTAPTDDPERPSPVAAAVTALAVKAIIQADPGAQDADVVRRGMRFVRRAANADGSFEGGALTSYVTSAVVSALAAFEADEFHDAIQDGTRWLVAGQWDQTEGLSPRQDWFGGAGYGGRGRPDLSNTQMMLDALYDSGMSPDEPAFQRALAFIARSQNLEATNPSAWAGNDGGFVYTPANGGESMASEAAGEGRHGELLPAGSPRSLRSYGGMTYAGFKSMLYAGLSPDDVRVRAAFDWIRRHWSFDENPGLGQQGLYYYYHTMSRALVVAQQDVITDELGREHDWREELIEALVARQRPDGSWQNPTDRWLEGEPAMATVYALLALEEALKPARPAE